MTKIRYEIDLSASPTDDQVEMDGVRTVSPADLDALGDLMLDAYMGTIDYDGEDYEDAVTEVGDFLAASPLLDHSYAVEVDGDLASAALVSLYDDQPFIGYVMTRAEHKGQGLARTVTRRALDSLAESGHEVVVFYITDGNLPSEALFRSLGARPTVDHH